MSKRQCVSGNGTTERYDVILLDHMMPEMDGIETLKLLKEMEDNRCQDVPVIALTANAIVGVREMYMDKGFDDYLSKLLKGSTWRRCCGGTFRKKSSRK